MQGSQYLEEVLELIGTNLKSKERIQLLRTILDRLFKELTQKYKLSITNLQPRMAYYFQQEKVDSSTNERLNELRIFCNKVVHNEIIDPSDKKEKLCIKIFSEFISSISKAEIPTTLKAYYSKQDLPLTLLEKKIKIHESIPEIQGFIESVSKEIKQDKYGKDFFDIQVNNDDYGVISVRITQMNNDDIIIKTAEVAWKFAEVILTNLLYDTQSRFYYSTNNTLLILEPTYLIDAKQIAECHEFIGRGKWDVNPSCFQQKKFSEFNINESIMKGYLLGNVLDDIVSNSSESFPSRADIFFKKRSIATLLLIKERGKDVTERIKIESQSQENNIRQALVRFSNHKCSIEPSFLSIKYGIQGRIDALYENKSNLNEKTVIELKSGNFNFSNPQHQCQTALYDLLLKSTFPTRTGNSYILYSQKPNDGLTLVNVDDATVNYIQRKAMIIRNKIVSDEYRISQGDMTPIYESVGNLNFNRTEKLYFDGFCKFIGNELRSAKAKHISTLLPSNNQSHTKYLSNLAISSVSDDYTITLDSNPKNELQFDITDFKENDQTLLFPVEPNGSSNPLHHQILKGTITQIDNNYIRISLINKQVNKDYFSDFKLWTICQDLTESTIKGMFQQIYTLVTSPLETRNLILTGEKKPSFSEVDYLDTPRLTKHQNQIVKQAICATDYFIIQGPPGTGKTQFILTEIVKNIFTKEKAVIIAYTNQAVFEISNKLSDLKIDFLQLGGNVNNPNSINHYIKNLPLTDLLSKIESSNIIVSTQHSLLSNLHLLNTFKYRTLIVDEASQLLESQLVGILTKFQRFILIGDEKQLPAVSLQEVSEEIQEKELKSIGLFKYNESLFYRLLINAKKRGWNCFAALKEQGRMHIDIADFPNKNYYNNQLQVISPAQSIKQQTFNSNSENYIERCLALKRVIFIPSERDVSLFTNDHEQRLIAEFIKIILQICITKKIQVVNKSENDQQLSIGIIAPFRKQIINIKRVIPDSIKEMILVDSIEKFQGSERDIIFYSTAVNNSRQIDRLQSLVRVDDLEIDRKLNVALTRAKKHLIITGTKSILEKNDHYNKLIRHIESHGGLINIKF